MPRKAKRPKKKGKKKKTYYRRKDGVKITINLNDDRKKPARRRRRKTQTVPLGYRLGPGRGPMGLLSESTPMPQKIPRQIRETSLITAGDLISPAKPQELPPSTQALQRYVPPSADRYQTVDKKILAFDMTAEELDSLTDLQRERRKFLEAKHLFSPAPGMGMGMGMGMSPGVPLTTYKTPPPKVTTAKTSKSETDGESEAGVPMSVTPPPRKKEHKTAMKEWNTFLQDYWGKHKHMTFRQAQIKAGELYRARKRR